MPHPIRAALRHCAHCPGSHTGALPRQASATTKARAWLLIEHPGPWADKVERTELPAPAAAAVAEAGRRGVRAQLIRRPGRRRGVPPLQVYAGWSGSGAPAWLEGRPLDDPAGLADLDLAAVAAGRRPGFGEPSGPLLLVCAHGRHNACCAKNGAPLARALHARYGSQVWETTHVGGDRYAANLVCLPHGLYYGDLGIEEGLTAAAAYREGKVVLDRLRGRAGLPEPAQAAEHQVRALTGALGVDAVAVESMTGGGDDRVYEVVVRARDERYRVAVRPGPTHGHCGPGCDENRRTYLCDPPALLNRAALV
ncbi:MAG TPA: sucrase ferredoxin [Streptosporangiaceae bacterium]|nr:sucrase ferredoxin [Streptosporangiaceae bacterium]